MYKFVHVLFTTSRLI